MLSVRCVLEHTYIKLTVDWRWKVEDAGVLLFPGQTETISQPVLTVKETLRAAVSTSLARP
jgi:hypothetical protein